ncbi:MAG: PAS domain S-box protein [Desulfobacterales bacterium]|nr:PAS domain S-box protein [Desulfobacterales bacterium]
MSEKVTRQKQEKKVKALDQSNCDRKLSEENLQLFKKVVENATDAIGISTPEGRHWYQNAAFDALFGDIGEDPPATLYCNQNVGSEVFETIMAGGEWSGEVQMYAADGRILDILLRAYAFTNETGRVLGLVGVHTDITASKRSQALFKLVAQSTNDVFYEWNVQTDSLQWFSDIATELGYAPGEVPPTIDGWIELIHPDDRPQLSDAVMKHRTATHDIDYLYRVKHKNGTWRYWRDHATPVLDNHNRPVRWVGGISDVTEHKQVENAYRESEARFLQITENIREVFWLFDLQEERLLYVSPAYDQIWGRSHESLYERFDHWFANIHAEDVKHAQETFNHMLDTGGGEPREYRIVRADGTERWIADTGYAVKDRDGKIVRIAGIAEDITERKKAEEALADKASMERIISEASRRFLTLTALDKSINACLADIGRFCSAGRAYLFQFSSDGTTMNNTYEWCAPGVQPEIENLQGLPLEMFPWWMKLLEAGENIHVKNVAELAPEARAEKEILEAQNIKSVLVVPFLVDNRLAGFMGFDNVASKRTWGAKELIPLRTLSEIIGAAVTRKRAVEALRQSEARFRDLANMLPQIVFETDGEGNLTFVNHNAFDTFGYTKEEFASGLNVAQMIAPQDRDRAADRVREIMKGASHLIGSEYRARKQNGTEFPVITYSTVISSEGRPTGLRGIMIDITDRKRAEQALRESEEKFSRAFQLSPDTVIITRMKDGTILDVNESFTKMTGYSREEAIGRSSVTNLDLWVNPKSRDRYLDELLRAGAVRDMELWFRTKNGGLRLGSMCGAVLEIGGEQCILGTIRDITEERRAAEQLAAEKERLAVTLRSIGDAVITTDSDGRIFLMNPVAEELTGWNEADAVGRPLMEVFQIVDERTREPCANPVDKVIATGQIVGLANHTLLIAKDGREFYIADSGAPILGNQGDILGVVLVFRDTTERQRMEKELLKMEKLQSLGVLAGGIAHDFNNFLAGIIGNLSLARLDVPPGHPVGRALGEMEKAALRAKDLTQQLLTFSKGGAPVKKVTRIDHLVRESSQFALHGSNVRCVFEIDDKMQPADVDEGQIAQVIHNLVINADQAMPDGGVVTIRGMNVSLAPANPYALDPGPYVQLSIRDQGAGIKRAYLKKVFDPYFTTKQKGSGLGLAVAYSIIARHDGQLTVDSTLGEGTTFTLLLPASQLRQKGNSHAPDGLIVGSGRILVMDDEDFIRKLVSKMLEKLGYEVALAEDGQQTLALYRQALDAGKPFDAVILDLTVPGGMGGKETMRQLAAVNPHVRAVVSSGYSNDPVMANYIDYGFKAAVKKPYRVQEMSRILHKVIKDGLV